MNSTLKSILATLPLCIGATIAGAQTTLISDTFGTSGALNGSTPDTTTNAASWIALTGTNGATSNGSVLSLPTGTTQTNVLDLGSNYFSSNPGVYTLSMDLTLPSGSTTNWVGLGFVTNPQTAGTLSAGGAVTGINPDGGNNGGSPWMFLRQNGALNVYRGPGTGSNVLSAATGTFASGSTYTLKLVLDTSQTNWTLDSFVGSTQLDLNGASVGNTAIFSANPDAIRYVGFSTAGGSFGTVTIDNFTLSVVSTIPEPANAAMLFGAAACLVTLTMRRRIAA